MDYIPYGRQSISIEDIEAVKTVLDSDWLTQGPMTERFENKLVEYCDSSYAVAVCNATAALHLSCLALGLQKGDILWTSPNTFVASANCALYCGATVDFVDIDSKTYNMDVVKLEEKLKYAAKYNKLPKIVIPVHFAGQSCDMQKIKELADKYGFKIIEDASHAIGGKYRDKKIGSCCYSDITVFSFHPVKIMTTGEGGAALTNNIDISNKLQMLKTHGITRKKELLHDNYQGEWYYEQLDLGMNYRLTDIQAALGVSQLRRVDEFVAKRHELVEYYNQYLEGLSLNVPCQSDYNYSAYHLYVITLHLESLQRTRQEIFSSLRQKGIGVNVHYIPVHAQPFYQKFGFKNGDFPEAESYYQRAITLPLYYSLTRNEQDFIIDCLKQELSL